ncbi:hypothetical protein C2845_PM03G26600 [Panicum miliaceum]|uniref:RNase H type-1 domain-containing protein n=1 Tax=Panicum miliaceum TaxID=4540 RepID=A0A3L6T9T7_PANMI|nr:hypothetical protein C2845_PM03G26600 [Panicum miliaceum]
MRPIARLPEVQAEKVCELFMPETRQWNVHLVPDSFSALDAEEILKLKTGVRMNEDLTAWAFERNGQYSVRSCYRLLKQESDQKEAFEMGESGASENEVRDITGCKLLDLHPATWTKDLLSGDVCSQDKAALFICGAWSLWSGRNARRHGRNSWNPGAAAKHIAAMVEDLLCLGTNQKMEHTRQRGVWKKPDPGWMKVNTDAFFILESHSGSVGAVIRDDEGKLLRAWARYLEYVPDVLTAEAVAATDGLLMARACGYDKIELELDNLSLVKLLRSEAGEQSPIAGLWHEIREMGRDFISFKISFVHRKKGSEAAHMCAKLALLPSPKNDKSDKFPRMVNAFIGNLRFFSLTGKVNLDSDCNPVVA